MKEVEALDKVIKFVEMKLEACGSFKDGPEGAALKSVMEYTMKLQEEHRVAESNYGKRTML